MATNGSSGNGHVAPFREIVAIVSVLAAIAAVFTGASQWVSSQVAPITASQSSLQRQIDKNDEVDSKSLDDRQILHETIASIKEKFAEIETQFRHQAQDLQALNTRTQNSEADRASIHTDIAIVKASAVEVETQLRGLQRQLDEETKALAEISVRIMRPAK